VKDENLGEKEEIEIKDINEGINEITLRIMNYVTGQKNEVCKELLAKIGMVKDIAKEDVPAYVEKKKQEGYKFKEFTIDGFPNMSIITISKGTEVLVGKFTIFDIKMAGTKIATYFRALNLDKKYISISEEGELSFDESKIAEMSEELLREMEEPEKDEKEK
jgi:hypothetical protein